MDEKPFKCPKHPNLPGYKDRRGLLQHFKNKHTPTETQEPDMKKALEVQNTKVPCSKGCGKRLDYHYVKTHELKCHPASQSEPRPSNISSRASAANEKTETCGQCNEVLQNQQALVDHYAQKHPSPQFLAAQIPASLPSQIINQPYASVTSTNILS